MNVLLIVLVVVAIAALGVLIWVLVGAMDTLRSVRRLADDADATVIPLTAKADATLDLVNAEVMRIDLIVDQVSDMVERVEATRRAAETTVDSAVDGASRFGKAVASVFKSDKRKTRPHVADVEDAAGEAYDADLSATVAGGSDDGGGYAAAGDTGDTVPRSRAWADDSQGDA